MTKVLKQFDSVCRGLQFTYRVIETNDEYQLHSYDDDGLNGSISWDKSDTNLDLLYQACEVIELRG